MKTNQFRLGNIRIIEKSYHLKETTELGSVVGGYGFSVDFGGSSVSDKQLNSRSFKKRAFLVEVRKNCYVDFDEINHWWDLYRLRRINPREQPSKVGTVLLTPVIPFSHKVGLKYIDGQRIEKVPELEGKKHASFAYMKQLATNYKQF